MSSVRPKLNSRMMSAGVLSSQSSVKWGIVMSHWEFAQIRSLLHFMALELATKLKISSCDKGLYILRTHVIH